RLDGAGRIRRTDYISERSVRIHSVDVRIQLSRYQHSRDDRGDGQLCGRTGVRVRAQVCRSRRTRVGLSEMSTVSLSLERWTLSVGRFSIAAGNAQLPTSSLQHLIQKSR